MLRWKLYKQMLEFYKKDYKPTPMISITADDAKESDYTKIFPAVKERGMRFCSCPITNWVGEGSLTWDMIEELHKHGNEIMSHSKTHPNLTELDTQEVLEELYQSKVEIEEVIGKGNCKGFSTPYGAIDKKVRKLLNSVYEGNVISGHVHGVDYDYIPFGFNRPHMMARCFVDGPNRGLEYAKEKVDIAIENNAWLILGFHTIVDDEKEEIDSGEFYEQDLKDLLDYINSYRFQEREDEEGVQVVTFQEGLNKIQIYSQPIVAKISKFY